MKKVSADYIDFDKALNVANKLLKDDKTKVFGLYIIASITTGLRVSDVRLLTFGQLRKDNFEVEEKKTKKTAHIKRHEHLKKALEHFNEFNDDMFFCRSQMKSVFSNTQINRRLKTLFSIEVNQGKSISAHSLRKSFGRRVYNVNGQTEDALIKLSEVFNHADLKVTRKYLGITKDEIENIYLSL